MSQSDTPVVSEPPDDDVAVGESPDGDRLSGDQARQLLWNRRSVLAALGSLGAIAAIAQGDIGGGDGNLYGGTSAMDKAYKIGPRTYMGPDSAKSAALDEIEDDEGWRYEATDTQVKYYLDDGAWQGPEGIGSETQPVPSVNTEEAQIGDARADLVSSRNLPKTTRDSNSNYRSAGATRPVPSAIGMFEDLSNFSAQGATTLSAETSNYLSGSQAMKMTNDGTDSIATVRANLPSIVDLSSVTPSVSVWVSNGAQRLQIQLTIRDSTNSGWEFYRNYTPDAGIHEGWVTLNLIHKNDNGADLTDVDAIEFDAETRGDTTVIWDSLRWMPKPDKAYVCFTFDDVDVSQNDYALPILEEYGFRGGVGVVSSKVGANSSRMTLSQLQKWHDNGHDMISHSLNFDTFNDLTTDEIRENVRKAKEYMLDNGLRNGSNIFTFPGGEWTEEALKIVDEYHDIGMTIQGARHPLTHTNPLLLSRGKGDTLSTVKSEIDTAIARNEVYIQYAHSVGPNGEISEADFRSICDYIEGKSEANLEVVKPSELASKVLRQEV